jgi:hypothetical protein
MAKARNLEVLILREQKRRSPSSSEPMMPPDLQRAVMATKKEIDKAFGKDGKSRRAKARFSTDAQA